MKKRVKCEAIAILAACAAKEKMHQILRGVGGLHGRGGIQTKIILQILVPLSVRLAEGKVRKQLKGNRSKKRKQYE